MPRKSEGRSEYVHRRESSQTALRYLAIYTYGARREVPTAIQGRAQLHYGIRAITLYPMVQAVGTSQLCCYPKLCGPQASTFIQGLSQTAASNFQSMWRPWKTPPMTHAMFTLKCTVDTHIEGFGAITTVCVELCVSLHHSEPHQPGKLT